MQHAALAASHMAENSWHKLLAKWWIARNSPTEKWQDELTCIKSKKSTRIHTSMYKSSTYTSRYITTETIATAMRKDQDDKCEVVGQD